MSSSPPPRRWRTRRRDATDLVACVIRDEARVREAVTRRLIDLDDLAELLDAAAA